jgi:hypothetical protein
MYIHGITHTMTHKILLIYSDTQDTTHTRTTKHYSYTDTHPHCDTRDTTHTVTLLTHGHTEHTHTLTHRKLIRHTRHYSHTDIGHTDKQVTTHTQTHMY